jgi:hypothetical protein
MELSQTSEDLLSNSIMLEYENPLPLKRLPSYLPDEDSISKYISNEDEVAFKESMSPNARPPKGVVARLSEGSNDNSTIEEFEQLGDVNEKFQCKTIVFTSYSDQAISEPSIWLKQLSSKCDWVLAQLELCPKTNRKHLQGMAFSKTNCKWGFMPKGCWKRKCIKPLCSIEYCSKSRTKLDGPWEFGIRPMFDNSEKQKKATEQKKANNLEKKELILKNDLVNLVNSGDIRWDEYKEMKNFKTMFLADQKIKETLSKPIDHDMTHLWVWGPTGTGKTTFARSLGDKPYLKTQNKWWCDYHGEDLVIIEDLGKESAKWIGDFLKIWADKWSFRAEFKGGQMEIRPKTIIVTSNYSIRDLFEDINIRDPLLRRFKEKYMGPEEERVHGQDYKKSIYDLTRMK